jgi:hypothetical protein
VVQLSERTSFPPGSWRDKGALRASTTGSDH